MKPRRLLQALLALLLLGVVKLPVERAVSARLKEARMLNGMADLGLWENLGQMGFAASLGGLRALVAAVTYMRAYVAFEDVEWARVDSLFQITSRLQPRDVSYWDEASWHMAYNAASHYLYSDRVEPVMRGKLYHDYIDRGIAILEDGLRFNPGDARLLSRLGDIYAKRKLEPAKAGELYEQAAASAAGMERYRRFAAYEYEKTADRALWERAHGILRDVYDREGPKYPQMVDALKRLEERLDVPLMKRIRERSSGRAAAPVTPENLPVTR